MELGFELLNSQIVHHPAVVVTAFHPFRIAHLLVAAEAATVYFPSYQINHRLAVAVVGIENQTDFLPVAVVVEQ